MVPVKRRDAAFRGGRKIMWRWDPAAAFGWKPQPRQIGKLFFGRPLLGTLNHEEVMKANPNKPCIRAHRKGPGRKDNKAMVLAAAGIQCGRALRGETN